MYTNKEYPLFPTLNEAGAQEAQALIDDFKTQITKAAEEAVGKLYTDVVPHIESASWTNYRNELMEGLRNYNNRKVQGEFDFKAIRRQIYIDFREDIIADLNSDLVEEIESLKQTIEIMQRYR